MHAPAISLLHAFLFVLLVSAPSAVAAQSGLTFTGGPASWDLSGTGTGTTVAIRWDRGLTRSPGLGGLSVEAGVGWFQDGQKGQGAVDLLLPEAGLRIGLPGRFSLGAGAGWAIGLEDRSGDDLSLWTALSTDLGIGAGWSLRPELRIRSVDPWVGTIVDYSLGIRRMFR